MSDDETFRIVMVAGFLTILPIAGGLLLWAFRSLGPNLTDTVVTRKAHTLITRGPYRWVRHPFYDAVAVFVLANTLLTANWFVFVAGSLAFALIVARTRREEENLLRRFGDSYAPTCGERDDSSLESISRES